MKVNRQKFNDKPTPTPAARKATLQHIRDRAGTWDGNISGEELLRITRPPIRKR
jgi:hypothetical protein